MNRMASWWRLRTHAYLVLSVLLLLIAFLGAYALNEAKRHAKDADELLGSNFKATGMIKEIEAAHAEQARTAAKFRLTRDVEYRGMYLRQQQKLDQSLIELDAIAEGDARLVPAIRELISLHRLEDDLAGAPSSKFMLALKEFERRLEMARNEKVGRIRDVARDLGKIILITLVIAIAITSWLAFMLYHAVLQPLDAIKKAARRMREGELSYRVEKFRGFSELTELRREFNAMASKLEELDSMKSDFLSTVSHELRTPLTAIKEGLHLMHEKQGVLTPAQSARSLDICTQAAKRLETMIQNLLNHAKMESGFYSYDERPKDFVSVLESSIHSIKPIAERRGSQIQLKVDSPAPKAAFSSEGIAHAIENLLLNAIKYGDSAHPIMVEVKKVDVRPVPQLEVRVTNRGKGLLPTELKQVFERFFRASNADGQKGVGLGLSVVKRIIEAHHGTVSAESMGGVTTFSFRIPQRYQSEAIA